MSLEVQVTFDCADPGALARFWKNRVHLDVRAAPGLADDTPMDALEELCTRLVAAGATRLRRFDGNAVDAGIIVMADPEGNKLCLD